MNENAKSGNTSFQTTPESTGYFSYGMEFGPLKSTGWTLGVWKSAAWDLFKLSAIAMLPVIANIVMTLLNAIGILPDAIVYSLPNMISTAVLTLLFNAAMSGIMYVTLDSQFHGNRQGDTLATSFKHSLKHLHHYAGMMLLWVGVVFIALLPTTLPLLLGTRLEASSLFWLSILDIFLLGVLSARLVVAWPAMVCEKLNPISAIKRSFSLTKGKTLKIILAGIVFGIVLLATFFVTKFLTTFVGAYPGFGPYAAFAIVVTQLLLFASTPFVYQFTLYGAFRDLEAGYRDSVYEQLETEARETKEQKPWSWIGASVGATAVAYAILFFFMGPYGDKRYDFVMWQYVLASGILMLISPLLTGLYIKKKAQLSSGIVIGLNWVAATLVATAFYCSAIDFESYSLGKEIFGSFAAALLLNLFAMVPWAILGLIGSLAGTKIRYGKSGAYLDELDDEDDLATP